MTRAQDKVAVVTGAAAGLGAAIVRRLVSEGANVIATDIQVGSGQRLADELGCEFIEQDVTDEKQWEKVIGEVEALHGALHVLVNGAGIEAPFEWASPERARLADWQATQRVNIEGVFLGCRAAIPALRRSGGGAIINLSSIAGPSPGFVAYGASQAAVLHVTRSVALHCVKNGAKIRCNSVHPGIVLTPMIERMIADQAKERGLSTEQVVDEFRSQIPQGEFQTPEDVANAVLFLASDEARHITGLAMTVDGGCSSVIVAKAMKDQCQR